MAQLAPRQPGFQILRGGGPQVREALGVRRTVISGGGSLAAHLDDFFEVGDCCLL
jgi:hypothetical protein